jgi:hypothetical protein
LCLKLAICLSGFFPAPKLGKPHRLLEDLARGVVTQGLVQFTGGYRNRKFKR